jgi:DUF1680 family protein
MNEIKASQVKIQDHFWSPRLLTNIKIAIFHQWRQLEDSHCIDNFRLVAGQKEGFREGWFFADSDAYKWLEASARVYASWPSEDLKVAMDNFIRLVADAQEEDGYIYTYNQIHFHDERWGNLMIEHELYCHGHLIEAGVSHFEATHEESAFKLACKSADLLVKDFRHASPEKTSGHEEVEIALLRLYEVTQNENYLELAREFLERRGKIHPFAWSLLRQNARVNRRRRLVQKQRQIYLASHPDQKSFQLPLDNVSKKSWNAKWRWIFSIFSGKYFQQHVPIRKQNILVGHSVRFTYLETASAMLSRLTGDPTLLPTWEGKVRLILEEMISSDLTVHFRIPSWARSVSIRINGEPFKIPSSINSGYLPKVTVASGFDPRQAWFLPILRNWSTGDMVDLKFEMPIMLWRASLRLPSHKDKVALTRGPLAYCLESNDNPGIDIFNARIDPTSIYAKPSPSLLGGIWILYGRLTDGREFIAIPYHLWANRGESQMTVWIRA